MDLFDQLTAVRVPPPPKNLERRVRRRLNRWLVTLDVVEFVLRVVPYAAGCFVRAVVGLLKYTLEGKHETK